MSAVQYYRKNHVITDVEGKVIFTGQFKDGEHTYPSINAAKRESRKLQAVSGPGSLRVKS